MNYVIREEGGVKFLAPNIDVYGSIYSAPVFYNPAMEKNRTLSVLLLKAFGGLHGTGLTVCEPLSGTGIRGIRYAVESGVVGRLILNDLSKEAPSPQRRRRRSLQRGRQRASTPHGGKMRRR